MNEILFFLSAIIAYGMIVFVAKYFGKGGLMAWIAASVILANIAVTKQVKMFGLDVTLGNIMFSSVYLCTDIISEVYGKKESKKAVNGGLIAAVGFIVFGNIINFAIPNDLDYVSGALKEILAFTSRTTAASVICFYLSNLCDVWLFDKFRNKSKKHLWLRNNVCTIVCNCVENFVMIFGAFIGIYDVKTCAMIAACTCVVEIIAGLLDTPFVYLGRKFAKKEVTNHS